MDPDKVKVLPERSEAVPVEDMPIAERIKLAEAFVFFQTIEPGWYIDAKDEIGHWCVAQVAKVEGSEVKIVFESWNDRFNDTVKIRSARLAPLRLHSICYTGQIRTPIHRLTFSLEDLAARTIKLEEVISSKFKSLATPFEVTQYLRGILFFYVHFLMSNEYKAPDKEIVPVIAFLKLVMKLIVLYIEELPSMMQFYFEGQKTPKLFLIDRRVALALCGTEILEMLKWFFCLAHRTLIFFARYDMDVEKVKDDYTRSSELNFEPKRNKDMTVQILQNKLEEGEEMIYGQFMNFFNYFCEIGGLTAVNNFLALSSAKPTTAFRLGLPQLALILEPFKGIKKIVKKKVAAELVEAAKASSLRIIQSFDEKDIKEISKDKLKNSLGLLKFILRLSYSDEEAERIAITHEMHMSIKFIQSPILEKRLNGIGDIKWMIDRVEKNAKFQIRRDTPSPMTDLLSSDMLANWIIDQKILTFILNENAHPELIKRTAYILNFLAKKGKLYSDILELLWASQLERHEDIIIVVYETIIGLIEFLTVSQINFIFSQIEKIPLESYDEKVINFAKEFTLRAIAYRTHHEKIEALRPPIEGKSEVGKEEGNMEEKKKPEPDPPSPMKYYSLPTLWKIVQDEASGSQAIVDLALSAIKDILINNNCSEPRFPYLMMCIDNIDKHKSIPQSIALAYSIIAWYIEQKAFGVQKISTVHKKSPTEIDSQYSNLNQKIPVSIIDTILNDFPHYFAIVASKYSGNGEIGDTIFVGKYKHSVNIDYRLRFLELIINNGPAEFKLGKERLRKLWDMFVTNCKIESDTLLFLKWLSTEKESQGKSIPTQIFTPEENEELFSILCKAHATLGDHFGLLYFKCFSKYFKMINIQKGNIANFYLKMIVKNYKGLVGIEELWENAINRTEENSKRKFGELIVDIYLNGGESSGTKKNDILNIFLGKCMEGVIANEIGKEEEKIESYIKLLLLFVDTLDGKKYIEPEESTNTYVYLYPVQVTKQPEGIAKKFEVSHNITIGQLRKKIADFFEIPFLGFQLIYKKNIIGEEENDSLFKEFGWGNNIYAQTLSTPASESPKLILAQNEKYIKCLFSLLSRETSAYIDTVWELLMSLPINEKINGDIIGLSITEPKEESWNMLLDTKSIHKFLYSLQIVENIIMDDHDGYSKEGSPESRKWLDEFCLKGGLAHLFNALLNLSIENLNHPLARKCFGLLLKILFVLSRHDHHFEKFMHEYDKKTEKMVQRILYILDAFATNSIAQSTMKQGKSPKKMKHEEKKSNEENPDSVSQEIKKKKTKQFEESRAFLFGFKIIHSSKQKHFNYFESMARYPNFKGLILKGLIQSENEEMQAIFMKTLKDVCDSYSEVPYSEAHPYVVLLPLMLKELIFETLLPDAKCLNFYKLLVDLIDSIQRKNLELLPVDYSAIIEDAAKHIIEHEVRENSSTDFDKTLVGLFMMLNSLLRKFPEKKEIVGQKYGLVYEILNPCLFEFVKTGNVKKLAKGLPPKCKSVSSRDAAFSLLLTLCRNTPANLKQVINFLMPLHVNGSWRTKRETDWMIFPETTEKSSTGYVGLKNLGCICYMNSLMQQLFMISSFRNDVLAISDPKKLQDPDENLLFQAQCLFAALSQSVKQYYNPKGFCHAFKDADGKPIKVYEQMDTDEFFNMFMDKLETALKGTPQENTIKKHFGGVFANQFICKDCPHRNIRKEPFMALNLQVKNKKSLQQCLESFVEGEMLQGDNAYHCEKCDKKVTTLKRVCIKRLPRYLICVLKRFGLNYDTMQKFKINSYCEFPMKINMEAFTEEGLAKRDIEKDKEKAKREGRDPDKEEPMTGPQYPSAYYEYKLTGVVIHAGTADSGHYYSLIMDKEKDWVPENQRWYEFNDTFVDQYDIDDLRNDAFGGEERYSGWEGMNPRMFEKIRNAYLLVYERCSDYEPPEGDDDDIPDAIKKDEKEKAEATKMDIASGLNSAIVAENEKYWHHRNMFHPSYFNFVKDIVYSWNLSENLLKVSPSKNPDFKLLNEELAKMKSGSCYSREEETKYVFQTMAKPPLISLSEIQKMPLPPSELKEIDLVIFKYTIAFTLTTLFRAKKNDTFPHMMDVAKAYMNKHAEAAVWLLQQFTSKKVISEFLFECPLPMMRRLIVGLLYCAMLNAYEIEKTKLVANIGNAASDCSLTNFVNCLFNELEASKKYSGNFEQFLQLFSRLAFLGPEMREYLIKIGALRRLMGFWRPSADLDWSSPLGIEYKETFPVELGYSVEVDEKFRSPFEEFIMPSRERGFYMVEPSYTFFFSAISYLLRSLTLEPTSPLSTHALTGCMRGIGVEARVKELLVNPKILSELLKNNLSKIAITSLSKAFAHISWNNMEFKTCWLKALMIVIDSVEYNALKQPFYLLNVLLNISDATAETVSSMAAIEIDTVLKNNAKAFYATLHALEFLAIIISSSANLYKWYSSNPSKWEWMLEWLQDNQAPPARFSSSVRPFKSKDSMTEHYSSFSYDYEASRTIKMKAQKILEIFVQVKRKEELKIPYDLWNYSSCYEDKFTKDQQVWIRDDRLDCFDKKKVAIVLDEMLCLASSYDINHVEFIEIESDLLYKAPPSIIEYKKDNEGEDTFEEIQNRSPDNNDDDDDPDD